MTPGSRPILRCHVTVFHLMEPVVMEVLVSVDTGTFKSVLGQWPSGVTVVTTLHGGRRHGMTASSFSSVSLDPPLVSVCLARNIWTHDLISESGVFAVNILAKDQADIGKRFAGMLGDEPGQRFDGLDVLTAETGCPLLGEALGWVDCKVVYAYPGGDHTIFVGEVLAADTPRLTAPLLFHSRAWGQFADQLPEDAVVVDTGVAAALRDRGMAPGTVASTLTSLRHAGIATRVLDLVDGPPAGMDITHLNRTELPESAAGAWARVASVAHVATIAPYALEGVDVAIELPSMHALTGTERAAEISLAFANTRAVVDYAREEGLAVRLEIPAAFNALTTETTVAAVVAAVELSPDVIVLVDDGTATPLSVREVLQDAVSRARPVPLAARLSDQTGLGLANALTAMKSGVRRLDSTLGGIGDSIATEDALHLLDTLEVTVLADRGAVVRAAIALETAWGEPLPGRTYRLQTTLAHGS